MFEFFLAAAVLALAFSLYMLRDDRGPVSLRHPSDTPPCDNCHAVKPTGVYFDGYRIQYLCVICRDEAHEAGIRG